ncbi:serine/threonine protein kinase [Actinoalloteichus sp. AHMU CJ021]|uniref:serine/threonine-protein kinase n=1 Tax=Actinoalloteichus TaxID=65496 RepID=UPI000A62E983|nr:serine/threonine-protein kinase [Actinoalloteichus caeruleus]AUS80602.1 serine/threonine protein kinase [Actinoalloteichus sp. AHMU CJ021]
MTPALTGDCPRPGCGGRVREGYCDRCGHATATSGDQRTSLTGRLTPVEDVPERGDRPSRVSARLDAVEPAPPRPPLGRGAERSAPAGGARPAPPGQAGVSRVPPAAVGAAPPAENTPAPQVPEPPRAAPQGASARPGDSAKGVDRTVLTALAGTPERTGRGTRPTPAGQGPAAGSDRTSTRTSGRGLLGGGLVEVPQVPPRDPSAAVLLDPEVPESGRFCSDSRCEKPVGRGRGGRPGRTEGYCPHCGARFSFTPKLARGDVVAGQYEVLGPIARGGFGWVYLARDRNVNGRWVALKGLLNSEGADAMESQLNEQRSLSEVQHPNIVHILNVVRHPPPAPTGAGETSGYIVMEYVDGPSLRELLDQRRSAQGRSATLPLEQAIAYVLEILPALGYLHDHGWVYCDLKPDNVIHTPDQVKLIDMGGALRLDQRYEAFYGTVGYQAPEIARLGPSVESDLYTVGRLLAVLSFPFPGYNQEHRESLPDPGTVPLLVEFESFDRLLRRACHPDRTRRFRDAGEMAEQLRAVLREVLALRGRQPPPGRSSLFTHERGVIGGDRGRDIALTTTPPEPAEVTRLLPVTLVDPDDPAAGFLAGVRDATPAQLRAAPVWTAEVGLRLVRAHLEEGDPDGARRELGELTGLADQDWRPSWYEGVAALLAGRTGEARDHFDRVYARVPGETAPKLALALADEADGAIQQAERRYRQVWKGDHTYVSAAFGLARVLLVQHDYPRAVAVLESVPETSSQYLGARVAAVSARVGGRSPHQVRSEDLMAAAERLATLPLDTERRLRLVVTVLLAARAWWATQPAGAPRPGPIFGREFRDHSLRLGLEEAYRGLARTIDDRAERIALVDLANAVRPRTLV